MPRFKIETSLFEPVTIEVEGGRTYESAPLSDLLLREMSRLEEQRKAKTLEDMAYLVQSVALIYGLKPEEAETIDIRILGRMVELANTAMNGGKAGKVEAVVPPPEVPPAKTLTPEEAAAAEVTAEKNALTPGAKSRSNSGSVPRAFLVQGSPEPGRQGFRVLDPGGPKEGSE